MVGYRVHLGVQLQVMEEGQCDWGRKENERETRGRVVTVGWFTEAFLLMKLFQWQSR